MSSLPHAYQPNAMAPGSTLILLDGRDSLDVLHRISTQSLMDLPVGQARATLFCEFRGRLLHRALVARTSEHRVWLLRDDAPGAPLAAHIDRHVFREDVRIVDHSPERTVRITVSRPGIDPGTVTAPEGHPLAIQLEAELSLVVTEATTVNDPLDAGSERARIVAGRPRHGHEIADEFNPYEVRLSHEVHLNKGCFTGQEALMRLITYKSVRRRLATVGAAGEPPSVPRDITRESERVGVLTSAAASDRGWIGLAVLKHDAVASGAALAVEGVGAIARPVPFGETKPLGLP